jgi:hypothetical protein
MNVKSNPTVSEQKIQNFLYQNCSHLLPVSLTLVINLYFRISPRIFVKIRKGPNWILWGPGETETEKPKVENLVSDSL